jgi:hypothetical protein
MRYLITLLSAGILSASAHAQNGFYASASAGTGLAGANRSHANPNNAPGVLNQSGIVGLNAKGILGYRYKNWRLETGIQYLRTGYQLNDLTFSSDFDPGKTLTAGAGKYRITYGHIGIPLSVGYAFPLGKKLSLVPSAGILASYNTPARTWTKEGGTERKNTLSGDDFKGRYNSISLWGTAALHLEYKINNKISLFGGPSVRYMISNFYKQPVNSSIFTAAQRNYNINIDLGVKFNF